MPLAWSIFLFWPTGRGKTKCFIWAVGLMTGSMAFCISGGKQYWQQRAAFGAGLCICRQHCAVNEINVGKIIRCLLLPQFAVRQYIRRIKPVYTSLYFITFVFWFDFDKIILLIFSETFRFNIFFYHMTNRQPPFQRRPPILNFTLFFR